MKWENFRWGLLAVLPVFAFIILKDLILALLVKKTNQAVKNAERADREILEEEDRIRTEITRDIVDENWYKKSRD